MSLLLRVRRADTAADRVALPAVVLVADRVDLADLGCGWAAPAC